MDGRSARAIGLHEGIGGLPRLDRIDIKILATLQGDGRMANNRLADIVGLSATPCLQRVRRLEATGYIRSYGAALDARALGPFVVVFTDIKLRTRTREHVQLFERYVQDEPLILECSAIAGGYDYFLKSVARDIEHYGQMMDAMMAGEVGVTQYGTYVSLREVKHARGFPLAMFEASRRERRA